MNLLTHFANVSVKRNELASKKGSSFRPSLSARLSPLTSHKQLCRRRSCKPQSSSKSRPFLSERYPEITQPRQPACPLRAYPCSSRQTRHKHTSRCKLAPPPQPSPSARE